jgi:hypothetical protein
VLQPRRTADPWLLGLCAATALVAAIVAIRDQRLVLLDDAAITFRYADRIAGGEGFTYNPGDRTNGASAPLYTLVLASVHLVGADLEAAARVIGAMAYSASISVVAFVVGRLRGLAAGSLAAALLLASVAYREQALTGMESAVAALLGLLVILLLMQDRPTLAGVALGLAVVNKVDAGLLALAVVAAFLIVDRRPPWRVGWTALAVAAPWFLFSTLYFGSPIPHSASQKLAEDRLANTQTSFDRTWVLDLLTIDRMRLLLLVAAATTTLVAVLALRRSEIVDRSLSMTMLAAGGWFALHVAAFSLVDLGDAYPWYTTVLYPPLVLTAVLGIFLPWPSIVPAPLRRPALGVAAAAVVALALVRWHGESVRQTATVVRSGHQVIDFERFERSRQEAGQVVGEMAAPGDVLTTCFGWPAYEAPQTVIDELCPLSTRDEVGEPDWWVLTEIEGRDDFEEPSGAEQVVGIESPTATSWVYRSDAAS